MRLTARVTGEPMAAQERTLVDVLRHAARENPEKAAFLATDGSTLLTWSQLLGRIERVAQGFLRLGLRPGERVAILSETRAEWVVADAAILLAGGVTVSAFKSFAAESIGEAMRASRVRFAVVEDAAALSKARAVSPGVEAWILVDGEPPDKGTLRFADLDAEPDAGALRRREEAIRPDDVAVIVYTSGTTGRPKGAMLTHRNLIANSVASIRHLRLSPHPIGLAFLPLAHSYQRQSGVVLALLAGAVAFSSPARLAEDLPRVRPTILPAVPRLYDRMHARIRQTAARMPPHRRWIFARAEATATEVGERRLRGEPIPRGLAARHALFERLVYRRIRRMAGLDRLELAITGAAAMRPDLLAFFTGLGIRIVEGYGLTETNAPSTVNPPAAPRIGTVGTPLPGTEVALAEDGEVLLAGPHVFAGYDALPEETSASFVEVDGTRWFLTGDVGEIDRGYLKIVDRKKELEALDTGKKVPPLPIEERLESLPLVAEAVVVAQGRKFVGALLVPEFGAILAWATREGVGFDPARTARGTGTSGEPAILEVDPALVRHPRVVALFAEEVERANATLADHEKVKAFRLLASALRAERGEITPTLKKRRRAILSERAADIEALFAGR